MSTGTHDTSAIYEQLAESLRTRIRGGEFKPGQLIDSEYNLAKTESISRMTVRRASEILIQEGLIERRPGKGLFMRGERTATRRVQVIAGNLQWEPALQASRGVQSMARKLGILPNLYDAHGDAELDLQTLHELPETEYDGAIIISLHSEPFNRAIYELTRAGFPFALVDQQLHDIDVPSVTADNYGGGYQAGQCFIEQGHRRMAFVGDVETGTVSDRLAGFRDAIADAGLPFDRGRVIDLGKGLDRLGDWSPRVEEAIRRLMAERETPTAIFFSCDAVARPGLRALNDMGLAVPRDVSLIGFDDDPLAQWMMPMLTTVRQPFYKMGQAALNMLHKRMSPTPGDDAIQSQVLPVELIERDSVGPAPTA